MEMHADTIVKIVAVVIALLSLTVSVTTVLLTRQHNRLSVRPSLTVLNEFGDPEGKDWGWILSNKGTGPALFRSMTIKVNGKPITSGPYEAWKEVIKQLGIVGNISTRSLGEGEPISAGEKIPLLVVTSKDQTERSLLRGVIARLEVEIVYASIYDQVFTSVTKGMP
jgi:hypothetical protein